jgi:hypothetical protein
MCEHPSSELTGLSCIAKGADTIFAEELVRRGGTLEVHVPCTDYREARGKPDHSTGATVVTFSSGRGTVRRTSTPCHTGFVPAHFSWHVELT